MFLNFRSSNSRISLANFIAGISSLDTTPLAIYKSAPFLNVSAA